MRTDKTFKVLIAEIKLEYIKKGKTPPSTSKITQIIAKKFNKEEIINYDKIIRF